MCIRSFFLYQRHRTHSVFICLCFCLFLLSLSLLKFAHTVVGWGLINSKSEICSPCWQPGKSDIPNSSYWNVFFSEKPQFSLSRPSVDWMNVRAKLPQSCPALCHSMDCSPASVHGILQAKILSGLPFPSTGDLLNPGIKPTSCIGRQIVYL